MTFASRAGHAPPSPPLSSLAPERDGVSATAVGSRVAAREVLGATLLVVIVGLVMSRYVQLLLGQSAPPGSDAGNWLAFARELFGGSVKAAEAGYPPLFPLALHVAQWLVSPLPAVKLAGLAAVASVAVPVYLILRTAGPRWMAALLAGAAISGEYAFEVFAWGGYPQLLGAAGLLLSLYWMTLGLERGKVSALVAAGLAAAAAVGVHQLAALELAFGSLALVALHASGIVLRPERGSVRRMARRLGILALATGAGLLLVVPSYMHIVGNLAGNPANPHGFHLLKSLTAIGGWHGDDLVWVAIAAAGLPAALWLEVRGSRITAARVTLAAAFGAGAVLLSQSEVRSVHLLQISLLLGLGVVPAALRAWRRPAATGLAIVAAVLVMLAGVRAAPASFNWYRVIDYPTLGALGWLRAQGGEGGAVVSGANPRGGIYGWWVEGYAGLPSFMAVDPRWLSYRSERSQADVALRILTSTTRSDEVRRLAVANGITHVLVDMKATPEARSHLLAAGFRVGVEYDHIVVMSLAPMEVTR